VPDLAHALLKEWSKNYLDLVESLPRRVEAVEANSILNHTD